MARTPSKYVERAALDREHRLRDLMDQALQLVLTTDRPDAVEAVRLPGHPDRYWLGLYGALRSQGGLVVIRFRYPGQRDSIRVVWLDEAYQGARQRIGTSEESTAFAVAYERLTAARNRICAVA